jgi:single-stranded-DNA-specific exonuclease
MKKWRVKKKIDKKDIELFPEINTTTLQLLFNRGLKEKKSIECFLNPEYALNNDPFLFKDMKKVVKEIKSTIEKGKKIAIFGDYDVDGVTSSVVLSSFLKDMGASLIVYIPNREKEGYGMNVKAIKKLKEKKVDLIITVDCGVSNYDEVELAKSLGMKVIVTDHHHPPKRLPKSLLINPHTEKDYPFKELAGVGVAFKLIQACIQKSKLGKVEAEAKEKWLLDLVALGTIADCVPLVNENRTLTKYGLIVLNKSRRKGLKKLIEISSLTEGEITSRDVGFRLSPRINAAGRMKDAIDAYDLLVSKSDDKVSSIAEDINKLNSERQKITESIYKKIIKEIGDDPKDKVLFSLQDNCPVGIVGLVAGKVNNYYNRPAFILTKQDEEVIGSGRSIEQFNMIKALGKMSELFSHFGGHSQACGLTLKQGKLFDDFKVKINKLADEILTNDDLNPILNIDAEIKLSDVNWGLFEDIVKFSPFGQGNDMPIFLTKNLKVLSSREVGQNNKHLKIFINNHLDEVTCSLDCIGFSLSEAWRGKLKTGDVIDLVYQIDENRWNGNRELQLKIVDLKHS